jgi:hypothetical protein
MTTLSDVLRFLQTADDVDKNAVRAVLGTPFEPTGRYGATKQARAVKAAATLSAINPGQMVTFLYNGVNYTGQVMKINTTTAQVRITAMSGPPTKKGVVVGSTPRVGASLLKLVQKEAIKKGSSVL